MADNAPEVLALPLPENPARIKQFLCHVWAFDHPVVTEEDRHRNAYYTQSQEFGREVKRATNLQDFIAGLQLEVSFSPLAPERLSRVAQLTQRTNQFNFTTIRRSEREIQSLLNEGYECTTVEVSDRFGGYGLVGVMLYRAADSALDIDSFLISCRALGRGVEHRMLGWLGEQAVQRGLATVIARLEPTRKNKPAQQFLQSISFRSRAGLSLRCTLVERIAVVGGHVRRGAEAAAESRSPQARKLVDYACIANELSTPAEILEAMRRESRHAGSTAAARG